MAEQELVIDVAQASDAQAILDFFETVAVETDYLLMDNSGTGVTAELLAANLIRRQDQTNQLCLLAKLGEQVVGMVNLVGGRQAKVAHVGDLFIAIRQAYWGQGLGSALMGEALYWAEEFSDLSRLELTVQARNSSAIALYEKHGFEHEGTKKRGAKSAAGDFLDVHLMAKMIG